MTSIKSIFNLKSATALVDRPHPTLITNDMVGVEVELEGLDITCLQHAIDPRVNVIEDGSLRNGGVEFVFNEPMYGTDVVESVHNIFQTINVVGDEPIVSDRCSIHVHLDVRDLEYQQILNLITVYLLCEPYFFKMGGTHRMNNAYTIPLASSRTYLEALGKALGADDGHEQQMFMMHIKQSVKYSALNVAPIRTQGSVEFRHHEGTTDPDRILNWINMVLSMKRYIRTLDEGQLMTTEFIDRIVTGGYEEFIAHVFEGCTVDMDIDSWSNAARVSKRLATIAEGISHTCTLSNEDVTDDNLFYTTQRVVGRNPIEDEGKQNLMRAMQHTAEGRAQPSRTLDDMIDAVTTIDPQWQTMPSPFVSTPRHTGSITSTRDIEERIRRIQESQRNSRPTPRHNSRGDV